MPNRRTLRKAHATAPCSRFLRPPGEIRAAAGARPAMGEPVEDRWTGLCSLLRVLPSLSPSTTKAQETIPTSPTSEPVSPASGRARRELHRIFSGSRIVPVQEKSRHWHIAMTPNSRTRYASKAAAPCAPRARRSLVRESCVENMSSYRSRSLGRGMGCMSAATRVAAVCGLSVVWITGCASQPTPPSVDSPDTSYVVQIEATSVGGLGRCTTTSDGSAGSASDGTIGLVTSTASDGGVTDSLYYCAGKSGTWTAITCADTSSGSVAYVPGAPGSLFVCSGCVDPRSDSGRSAGADGCDGSHGCDGSQGGDGSHGCDRGDGSHGCDRGDGSQGSDGSDRSHGCHGSYRGGGSQGGHGCDGSHGCDGCDGSHRRSGLQRDERDQRDQRNQRNQRDERNQRNRRPHCADAVDCR